MKYKREICYPCAFPVHQPVPPSPRLFFTPLSPEPYPIDLPENKLDVPIMEFSVPAREVARARVQLNATISTEIFADPGNGNGSGSFFNVNAITYKLFRDNMLLTDTLISGSYASGTNDETLYTFNSTFTWVDTPTDPIVPTDPIHYRIVANIGDYEHVVRAQVRNRGFFGIAIPGDPV
ncbi:hypothetical protein QUG02_08655 [Bacillus hominis]|uniref:Exosporium leader peptide n=1 Tax=Bacillus hominis TaxID=2817478 RepID=A0ABT7R5J6_9BACI|nr:hypothetical protein [Bacillus hominis]MDM5193038.1 hypothetical protein [Bacillus hominis]MDM5432780.1 hypothetical protein [Bacillus hominis]MDM5438202.1 hypothetical protein [Bacillus hominis]